MKDNTASFNSTRSRVTMIICGRLDRSARDKNVNVCPRKNCLCALRATVSTLENRPVYARASSRVSPTHGAHPQLENINPQPGRATISRRNGAAGANTDAHRALFGRRRAPVSRVSNYRP